MAECASLQASGVCALKTPLKGKEKPPAQTSLSAEEMLVTTAPMGGVSSFPRAW